MYVTSDLHLYVTSNIHLYAICSPRPCDVPLTPSERAPHPPCGLTGARYCVRVQLTLGIATLLLYVPTPVAAAHQTGALTLLSLAVWMTHECKLLKYVPK